MDRLNILYCSYRDWAGNILTYAEHFMHTEHSNLNVQFVRISTTDDLLNLDLSKYDLLFFIGWSEIIPDSIVKNNYCICLHPSPLPKYRGGSPIQHQIINGDYDSAISFFIMDEGIDTGDILYQIPIKLEGELSDIFTNIVNSSYTVVCKIIIDFIKHKKLQGTPQNDAEATMFKRRTKHMSEIQISDFSQYTATQLYDKVRSLQNPYPNAFIRCKDDTILYITNVKL
jgi:methionyl-tRNA formyltransferase